MPGMMQYHLSRSESVDWARGEYEPAIREAIKQNARHCAVLKGIRFCKLVSYAGRELTTIEILPGSKK